MFRCVSLSPSRNWIAMRTIVRRNRRHSWLSFWRKWPEIDDSFGRRRNCNLQEKKKRKPRKRSQNKSRLPTSINDRFSFDYGPVISHRYNNRLVNDFTYGLNNLGYSSKGNSGSIFFFIEIRKLCVENKRKSPVSESRTSLFPPPVW